MDNIFQNLSIINKILTCKVKLISVIILLIFSLLLYYSSLTQYLFSYKNSPIEDIKLQKNLRNLQSQEIQNKTNILLKNITINNTISQFLNISTNHSNTNLNNFTIFVKPLHTNITEKVLFYNFIKDLTRGYYYGVWENLNVKKNKFKEKKGDVYFNVYRRRESNYLINLGLPENNSNLSIYLTFKDGDYVDSYIESNFTFNLDNSSLISNLEKESFSLIIPNTSISYAFGGYIDVGPLTHLKNAFINITFYKTYRTFLNKMEYQISGTNYGKITIDIKNNTKFLNQNITKINPKDKIFEVFLSCKAYGSHNYSEKMLNYSIVLTIFIIIEILCTAKFLKLINENNQIALNTDLSSVISHIMWCSIVSGVNFYFSMVRTSSTNEFLMPSFALFILFAGFLLRILFLSWKSRNNNINDMTVFRKKLLKFYLIFYVVLFLSLVSIQLWYTYFILTCLLFCYQWISQIIYSARSGTRPPMPYSYIFCVSLFKIFISFYLKGYSNNIFGYRPSYLKAFIISLLVGIEGFILVFQKFLGPKFFIPAKFRKKGFCYYKDINEISENDKEQECVICLDKIENIVNMNNNLNEVIGSTENKNVKMLKKKLLDWSEKLKNKTKLRLPYMVTPCHHVFHSSCLESWLEIKNECPCCRQKIPPLED